ncbi:hypothetical protein GCM10010341_34450 [Streptomyces noursei]|nr:hypothetical protein GCM10010341_34450 [Streptomyces noursei]
MGEAAPLPLSDGQEPGHCGRGEPKKGGGIAPRFVPPDVCRLSGTPQQWVRPWWKTSRRGAVGV